MEPTWTDRGTRLLIDGPVTLRRLRGVNIVFLFVAANNGQAGRAAAAPKVTHFLFLLVFLPDGWHSFLHDTAFGGVGAIEPTDTKGAP